MRMRASTCDSRAITHRSLIDCAIRLIVMWPVDKEGENLCLPNVVECYQTDISIRESVGALLNFTEHRAGISAAKHGEFPHGPVPVVIITCGDWPHTDAELIGYGGLLWCGKLKAGNPAVIYNVVYVL